MLEFRPAEQGADEATDNLRLVFNLLLELTGIVEGPGTRCRMVFCQQNAIAAERQERGFAVKRVQFRAD